MASGQYRTLIGNFDACKKLVPGTFRHIDELVTEMRENPHLNGFELDPKHMWFTADGNIYSLKQSTMKLGIIRASENLVLADIEKAHPILYREKGVYFPPPEKARASLEHPNTLEVEIAGLELIRNTDRFGHFSINPRNLKLLNSQQKLVAQRVYGPDEETFMKNLEWLIQQGFEENIAMFVSLAEYIQSCLEQAKEEYLSFVSGYCGAIFMLEWGSRGMICSQGTRLASAWQPQSCLRGIPSDANDPSIAQKQF